MKRHVQLGLCASVLLVAAAVSVPAQAATASITCGSTIKTSVTLTKNLTCTNGEGLTLYHGVTLNLGGHTLTGPASAKTPASGTAITLSSLGPDTVTNGTIQGWQYGIVESGAEGAPSQLTSLTLTNAGLYLDDGADVALSKTKISTATLSELDSSTATMSGDTVTGATVSTGLGADLTASGSTFTNSDLSVWDSSMTISGSTLTGGEVIGDDGGSIAISKSTLNNDLVDGGAFDCVPITVTGSTIENYSGTYAAISDCAPAFNVSANTFTKNTTALKTYAQSYDPGAEAVVTGNKFTSNGIGVEALGGTNLNSNSFTGNTTGLNIVPGDIAAPKTISSNTFTKNTSSGIHDTDGSEAIYANNTSTDNGRYGIYAPGATDGGGNVATGNKLSPQCVGVVCAP